MLAYITYFIVTVIIRFVQLEVNLEAAAAGRPYKTLNYHFTMKEYDIEATG